MTNNPRRGLLDGMADIVGDLWGAPEAPAPTPAPESTYTAPPVVLPFAQLWKTADEPIDWTDALASPTPTDGLTSPEKWTLYHQHAASVLRGDLKAYLAVLRAANPMADLTPYADTIDVTAQNADTLRATFTARADLLTEDRKGYLCGMAVRIARDLFAVLPVTRVAVEAAYESASLLSVTFDKADMNKVRFAFIDPVEFTVQCGGVFTKEE